MGGVAPCMSSDHGCRGKSADSLCEHPGGLEADIDLSDTIAKALHQDDGAHQQGAFSLVTAESGMPENDETHPEVKTTRHSVSSTGKYSLDSEVSLSGSDVTVLSHESSSDENSEGSGHSGSQPRTPSLIVSKSSWVHRKNSSNRNKKRRQEMRLLITHTMGLEPSKALMLVIENTDAKLENHYDMGALLGKGSFGVVCIGKLKLNGAARAVKSISKDRMKKKCHLLKQEIHIMKTMDHPNLLMLLEIFEDERRLHLVLEFCAGGSLGTYVDKKIRLTELQGAVVMQQVIRAALYLHNNNVCHRDLKADNCLLADSGPLERTIVKVADFGISCFLAKGKVLKELAGTPTHMAPEVVKRKYKHSCDIWSCGIMAYNLLCNDVPFKGSSNEEIFDKIKNASVQEVFRASEWVNTSEEAIEFVFSLLVKSPRTRPSAREALTNAWIQHRVAHIGNLEAPKRLISNLRRFREGNKFQRAILQTIASMLPSEDTLFARQAFILLDADGDGMFSVVELADAFRRNIFQHSIEVDTEVRALESTFSDDEHKAFTYHEFIAAIFDKQKAHKQGLFASAFRALDKSDDNMLQISEITTGHLLGKLTSAEIQSVVGELLDSGDLDNDGAISYSEYLHMFSGFSLRRTMSHLLA